MAKGVGNGVPVFHVNGDDVEAVMWCFETAVEWRNKFGKDVIVDIVSYRRHGHDDIENPMVSNPSMYTHIATQKPLLEMYLDEMCEERKSMVHRIHEHVVTEYDTIYEARGSTLLREEEEPEVEEHTQHHNIPNPTSMPMDTLRFVGERITTLPNDSSFQVHPEVKALYEKRSRAIQTGEGIDMGLAESLAFGRCGVRVFDQALERIVTFSNTDILEHQHQTGTMLLKYIPGDDADNWHEYPIFPLRKGSKAGDAERRGWDLVLQAEALQRGTHPDVHVRVVFNTTCTHSICMKNCSNTKHRYDSADKTVKEEPSINDMLWS